MVAPAPGPPARQKMGSVAGVSLRAGKTMRFNLIFRPAFAARFSKTSYCPHRKSFGSSGRPHGCSSTRRRGLTGRTRAAVVVTAFEPLAVVAVAPADGGAGGPA